MIFSANQKFSRCTVIHSLPGRVRIRCDDIKYLNNIKKNIEYSIKKSNFIKEISINVKTRTALVVYDYKRVSLDFIKKYLSYYIGQYSFLAVKALKHMTVQNSLTHTETKEDSVSAIMKRIGITTGTLLYAVIRNRGNITTNSIASAKNFLTIPSIISLALTAPIIKNGFMSVIKTKHPNEDTLTGTSIIASLLLGKDISALTIILLSNIAELMTTYTMEKTRNSIKDMLSLNNEYAWKSLKDGSIKKVKISEIHKNDIVVINTGEKICVDGIVISGEGAVDQSPITGEYMPEVKSKGVKVFAGSILKNGMLTVNTEKAGDNTMVSRILHLVDEAANNKAPMQNYANRFSNFVLPFSFLFSAITYLVTKSSARALNMLIIDFCCGIKLSTAAAFSAAINNAVKNGVLIKGGNYIENMAISDTLIFDKTGTLTEGKPQVTSIISVDKSYTEREIVEISSAAEETSNHPLALGILYKMKQEGWKIPIHDEIKTHISRGTETSIKNDVIRIGSKLFMEESDIDTSNIEEKETYLMNNGEKLIYVAVNNKLIGIIGIQDKVRENMKKAINNLRYRGIDDIILLTGDLTKHAEMAVDKMNIDSFKAELLPIDKVKAVRDLKAKGSKVIMVGDGVNDAPALANADVGISLGSSSTDIAVEASDVTIQGDNPMIIPGIIHLSQTTMKIIKQNFTLVFAINSIGIILSATGFLSVLWGAVLHNSSTILVIANSTRLLFFKINGGKNILK